MPASSVKKVIAELNKHDLSLEERSLLITAVLGKIAALPLRDIIIPNEEGLFVNGRKATSEEQVSLRESAIAVLNSKAFRLIREQVLYATFVQATKSAIFEDMIFSKAAVWFGQQEETYLRLLAGNGRNGHLAIDED